MIDGVEGPEPDADPLRDLDVAPVADAIRRRRQIVVRLRDFVDTANRALTAAAAARIEAERAESRADDARELAQESRGEAEDAAETHRSALTRWAEELADHVLAVPAAEPAGAAGWLSVPVVADVESTELRAMAADRVGVARATAEAVAGSLEQVVADATLRVRDSAQRYLDVADELARVRSAAELPVPRAGWHLPSLSDRDSFAALVDFPDHLDAATRAGLEAACEAAGLLAATVRSDGTVVAENGELLLVPAEPVAPNLTSVLIPALEVDADVAVMTRVLAAVGLGASSAAQLWMDIDGRFGSGALRGRHTKTAAEHIGIGAREAARQRRIAALEADLASAESQRDAETEVLSLLQGWRDVLRRLVRDIPPTRPVDDAVAEWIGAVRDAQRLADAAAAALFDAVATERRAEQSWAIAETEAAQQGLPATDEDLQGLLAEVDESAAQVRRLPDRIDAARRSLRDWTEAVAAWSHESTDLVLAEAEAARAETVASGARTSLSAAEAVLGEEPHRVAATVEELKARRIGLEEDLQARRTTLTSTVDSAATARAELAGADEETRRTDSVCAAQRDALRTVLDVDGLLAAARDGGPDPLPTCRTPSRALPSSSRRCERSCRIPLRKWSRRRSTVRCERCATHSAPGWDAGSRRAGDGAPAAVEVSGPYGRRASGRRAEQVAADLRRARGLLTAQQDQALRNLLHGRVAREVARALFDARELVAGMNGDPRTRSPPARASACDWSGVTAEDLDPEPPQRCGCWPRTLTRVATRRTPRCAQRCPGSSRTPASPIRRRLTGTSSRECSTTGAGTS